jgi:hypothetical protein
MADTGNPWFIPFAEPSDLVRDWPALSSAVGTAVAAGLSAAGNAGIGSNVVQTVKTDVFTTSSDTYTTVTGLTVTITPTTATSKVLLIAQVAYGLNAGAVGSQPYGAFKITRGATDIYHGDADGVRIRAVFGGSVNANMENALLSGSIVFLDNPTTTSPVTYNLEVKRTGESGTVSINRSANNLNSDFLARGASSISAIEVKA